MISNPPLKESKTKKYVYTFGNGAAEGNTKMRKLLGGKGADLAEMNLIGIPVPPGFTLTTEVCNFYNENGKDKTLEVIKSQIEQGIRETENIMGTKFGDTANPLLLSVRSGARVSMPGMMDTVLNLGLNEQIVAGISKKWNDPRFAWDAYRRLVQMYGNVVMGLKNGNKEEEDPFEIIIHDLKSEKKVKNDADLSAEDLKVLVSRFKKLIKTQTGNAFPEDPYEQLIGAILAVFESWNNERAQVYRSLNNIPEHWGTAVNVQAMVYGNLNNNSATGVAFTRDAATGENLFNGEFLFNAQGEDVVAGIRTPQQITLEGSQRWAKLANIPEAERKASYPSLEEVMPEVFRELIRYETMLEKHYKDMQDVEFTIQEGKLWMLQTRSGKRTGVAAVKIAMDMLDESMIDEKTALTRINPERLDDLLHPVFKAEAIKGAQVVTQGLPASPGAATGQIVFFADEAETWAEAGKGTILVRIETSPEDLRGINAANGILTARGGMTSHAAVVARGMGKCCVSGAGTLHIDYKSRTMTVDGQIFKEGDWISLNGTTGEVYKGKIDTEMPVLSGDFKKLMELSDKYARLEVRTNADTPEEAETARGFGAKGIGLCRTEHMFFEGDRIIAVREMILASDEQGRRKALAKLLPMQKADFEGIFETMHDLPVTIRLLDPPLHEFLPHTPDSQREMAEKMNLTIEAIQEKIESLDEVNPMLGHRGCRLGITYPEITEMQTQAIIEAALSVKKRGIHVFVEIMIPLIGRLREFTQQESIIRATAQKVFEKYGDKVDYHIGTMIEIPRAALTAGLIAEHADFFSFGTNDLTQMTFGFSRDDVGKFLPIYLKKKVMNFDPFKRIDEVGVGRLVRFAIKKGRKTNPALKLGICGEHGGNPESINFFHKAGLDYVSCSPFRVPIARLSAAQAKIKND